MQKMFILVAVACLLTSASLKTNSDTPIKGAWKATRTQYGKEPMVTLSENEISHKLFTGTRWSAVSFDKITKKITGTAGGTYTLRGSDYKETVEYYSWDSEVVGKTFQFTMTIENGMLHQKGFMEWKGDPKYSIEEFYSRVD
ncbi:MAG: hypothetical protein HC811_12440 [Flammeovirgaceae bacterium]|nr:hypothetical protein [Flammeovirgaceae bacterium]